MLRRGDTRDMMLLSALRENVAIISSVTALVAVFVGPYVSYLIAKKQLRGNILLANRVRWIEAIQEELGNFSVLYMRIVQEIDRYHKALQTDPQTKQAKFEEIQKLTNDLSRIRLALNLRLDHEDEDQKAMNILLNSTMGALRNYMTSPEKMIDVQNGFVSPVGNLALKIRNDEWRFLLRKI
jgi:hypothetical protein